MPLYDLLVLARPALVPTQLHQLIRKSCNTVLSGDGVITKITYNGLTPLAYTVKKTQGHFDKVRHTHARKLQGQQQGIARLCAAHGHASAQHPAQLHVQRRV